MKHHSHQHQHQHDPTDHHHGDTALPDMLDLDAEVFGSSLEGIISWAGRYMPQEPGMIVDVGAGTGTGGLALARRFPTAGVTAVDQSEAMLERLLAAARERGLADRTRAVQADLDTAWPGIGGADLVWAASSLHHVADPARVLDDLYAALVPGGLLVVVEMDGQPRFLPEDAGAGTSGLEERCHTATALAGWNAHPDWGPVLRGAGFGPVDRRNFTARADAASVRTRRYAHACLSRMRTGLAGHLDTEDLAALDRLLGDGPGGVLHREDLDARSGRTAWAARRP